MTSAFDGLPPNLREIAEVAGLEAAMKLAASHGGIEIKIPHKAAWDSQLVRCVGQVAADRICAHFCGVDAEGRPIGGVRLLIPKGGTGIMEQARRRLATELQSGNVSVREAARRAGLGERAAWRMKAKLRSGGDDSQGSLF